VAGDGATSLVKNDLCIIWWQPTCSMSTRMFVPGHHPGLLLVFYHLWDQNHERGGNSKSVRNTELMMEYNYCLLRKLAQQIECEKEKHFKIKLYNVLLYL
jgi:hypothetical protein